MSFLPGDRVKSRYMAGKFGQVILDPKKKYRRESKSGASLFVQMDGDSRPTWWAELDLIAEEVT